MAAPGATYPAVYAIGTVGGVAGVYRSTDEAKTWVQVNDSLHQYGEMDNVAGDENYYGRVFVTTQGRGIPYGEPLTTAVTPSPLYRSQAAGLSLRRVNNWIVAAGTGNYRMELLDMRGRVVRQGTMQGGTMKLSLSGLQKGVYIARYGSSVLPVGFGN
jgi:hypothetical protein